LGAVAALALAAAGVWGERAPAQTVAPPPVLSFATSGDAGFDAWRADFAARAIAQGRNPDVVRRLLDGLRPDPQIIQQDQNQAEFVRPPWEYVNGAVSPARVQAGQTKRAENAILFGQIQERFGVDADIVAGIWGVETNFGAVVLKYDAADALATLAYDQRRRGRFEGFLLSLMEMVERGYAGPSELKSSWAGAMGQPQFMPDMYLSTAIDWDGDGRRDIWSNTGDVLASIANYLAKHGWKRAEPVFEEVRLPGNFDYALADNTPRPVSEWQGRGVTPIGGTAWSAEEGQQSAQLYLPAGWQGPALLLFDNFQVIKTYNNSDRYALAVALLARAFKGQSGLVRPWPTQLGAMRREDILALQQSLTRTGYDAGAVDGMFGAATRRAVRAFQQANAMPADGYPTDALLEIVRARDPQASAMPKPTAQALLLVDQADGRPLSKAQIKQLQRNLNALGYRLGAPNGIAGAKTRAAIAAEERKLGLPPTGRATSFILAQTRKRLGR
jgi:membrane-bound lytic murein transglycosylase B